MELDDALYSQITDLTDQGNDFMDQGAYGRAIGVFEKALNLLPSPKSDWEAATWIHASLGDAQFMLQNYADASEHFFDALNCPGGPENPFIRLRLGECLYRMGNQVAAKEHLLRAYMLEGKTIFGDEPPEYFEFLRAQGLLDEGNMP